MQWTVQQSSAFRVIEADHFEVMDNALIFLDAEEAVVEAIGPDNWLAMWEVEE